MDAGTSGIAHLRESQLWKFLLLISALAFLINLKIAYNNENEESNRMFLFLYNFLVKILGYFLKKNSYILTTAVVKYTSNVHFWAIFCYWLLASHSAQEKKTLHRGFIIDIIVSYFYDVLEMDLAFLKSVPVAGLCLFHSVKSTACQSAIPTAMLNQ